MASAANATYGANATNATNSTEWAWAPGGNGTNGTSTTTQPRVANLAGNILMPALFLGAWGLLMLVAYRWNQRKQARAAVRNSRAVQAMTRSPAHIEYDQLVRSLPETADPRADPALLQRFRAALINRAIVDVQQTLKLREQRPALMALLRDGAIEEELWSRFLMAEKELEMELGDVAEDAEHLVPGWGQTVIAEAHQVLMRAMQHMAAQQRQQQQAGGPPAGPTDWAAFTGGLRVQVQGEAPPAAPAAPPTLEQRQAQAQRAAAELLQEEESERARDGKARQRKK